MKIDLGKEKNIWFLLALLGLSYAGFLGVRWLEHFLPHNIHAGIAMFHIVTFPIIFALFLKFFEHIAWKWSVWHKIGIVDFPNIEGVYEGEFTSSYKSDEYGNPAYKGVAEFHIKQTASRVRVHAKFQKSESISRNAFFAFDEIQQRTGLHYFYQNQPRDEAEVTMHPHHGSAVLYFDAQKQELHGEYYTGRDRNDYGDLVLKKVGDHLPHE